MKFIQSNKTLWYGLFIAFFVLTQIKQGFCQFDPPQNFKQKMAFVESKTSYYVLEDFDNLTILEKLKLQRREDINFIEKIILDDETPLTRITFQYANYYEDWMTKPHLTVIDDSTLQLYNKNGLLTSSIPHTSTYLELQSKVDELKYPSFPDLTQSRMDSLMFLGAQISNISNNEKLVSFANIEMVYNSNDLYLEKRKKDSSGKVIFVHKMKYKKLANEMIVPLLFEERKFVRFNSGVCGEFIQRTIYSKYDIADNRSYIPSNSNFEKIKTFDILPNPSRNRITVKVPYFNSDLLVGDLNIFSLDGKIVEHEKVIQNNYYDFFINDWTRGIYFVKLTIGEKVYTTKFVKQ